MPSNRVWIELGTDAELAGKKLIQPIAFIAGAEDSVMSFYGGQQKVEELMNCTGEQCDFVAIFPGAGHWIQQEKPDEVNDLLLKFANDHKNLFSTSPDTGVKL